MVISPPSVAKIICGWLIESAGVHTAIAENADVYSVLKGSFESSLWSELC